MSGARIGGAWLGAALMLIGGNVCFAWAPETAAGLTEAAAYASPLHVLLIEDWGRPLGLYEPLAKTMDDATAAALARVGDAEGLAPAFFKVEPKKGAERPSGEHVSGRHSTLGWLLLGAANAAIDVRSAEADAATDTAKTGGELVARFHAELLRSATATTRTERDAASVTMWLTLGALAHLVERHHTPPSITPSAISSVATTFGRYGIPNATMVETPSVGPIKALFSSRRHDGAVGDRSHGRNETRRRANLPQKVVVDLLGQIGGRVEGLFQRLFAARVDLRSDDDKVSILYDGPRMERASVSLIIEDDAGGRQVAPFDVAAGAAAPALGTGTAGPTTQGKSAGALRLGPTAPGAMLGEVPMRSLSGLSPSGVKLVAIVEGKDAAGDTVVAVKETPISTLRKGLDEDQPSPQADDEAQPVDAKTIPFGPEPPPARK